MGQALARVLLLTNKLGPPRLPPGGPFLFGNAVTGAGVISSTNRRANAGLNKGEARNALARAVFFHRLGELRDRSCENRAYRASGLDLLVAAIILWNTPYLHGAVDALRRRGTRIPLGLPQHVAPLGWEHITVDYIWAEEAQPEPGTLRPLRDKSSLLAALFRSRSREPDSQSTFVS